MKRPPVWVPCSKCGLPFDNRGIKNHEENCAGRVGGQ